MATGPLFWALKLQVRTVTKPRTGRDANLEPRPNALDKLVLIALADQADEADWSAMIGVEEVAAIAMCTPRAVSESTTRLEAAGYLRRRRVVVEKSGAATWTRYYLLAPASPITRSLIEVDWGEAEEVSGRELRRLRGRVLGRVTTLPLNQVQGGGMNLVQGMSLNQVQGGSAPGSGGGGEPGAGDVPAPGSGLTYLSSPRSSIDRPTELAAPPSNNARDLVLELNYGAHPLPSAEDVDQLARLVDLATTEHGLTLPEVRRHAQTAVNRVRRPQENGRVVPYLASALGPKLLPVPRPKKVSVSPTGVGPSTAPREDTSRSRRARESAMAEVRRVTKASKTRPTSPCTEATEAPHSAVADLRGAV